MSLGDARLPDGRPVALTGAAPFAATELVPLVGVPFELPCDDPWLRASGDRAHAYLEGARAGWTDHPEFMDFLDEDSPVWDLKTAERDLYLHRWRPWLRDVERVLDVGCGIGRFVCPLLDRGASIWGIDGDLQSLQRCAWHAAGRPGSLELHWSSVQQLPAVEGFDLAIAAEVLCYVPEAERVLAAIAGKLRPGGTLLLSMESRWGWAASQDAPAGALKEALGGDGVVDLPGDRFVRTMERAQIEALVSGAGLDLISLEPSHWLTDGPLEGVLGAMTLEEVVAAEASCAEHPVWAPLHRLWLAAARRP